MKKILFIILLASLAGILYFSISSVHVHKPIEEREQEGLEYLNDIHRSMDPKNISELKEIILNHPDDYVRERAIFVLTDIAIRSNNVDDVIDFLKKIAYNEKDDEVRTAAYANLDLIREYYPIERVGDLKVRVEGDVRKGGNISLVLTAYSKVDVIEAKAGIKRIVNFRGETTPETILEGAVLSSRNPVRFILNAGESKDASFTIHLKESGEYIVSCMLKLDIDRVDYQVIEKQVYLKVEEGGGEYKVIEDLEGFVAEMEGGDK